MSDIPDLADYLESADRILDSSELSPEERLVARALLQAVYRLGLAREVWSDIESTVRQAVARAKRDLVGGHSTWEMGENGTDNSASRDRAIREAEYRRVTGALAKHVQDPLRALAGELGTSRMNLYKKLHKYGIIDDHRIDSRSEAVDRTLPRLSTPDLESPRNLSGAGAEKSRAGNG